MTTFVIVPVKKLDDAKSRLSPLLLNNERKEFCLKMLEDVLATVKTTRLVQQTVVVSMDTRALRVAKSFNAVPLTETQPGLNRAVSEATCWCIQKGATSALILPADIPLITSEDVDQIINLSEGSPIVISPSQDGGTNALLQKPPNLIPTRFGRNSFVEHLNEASVRGVLAKVYRSQRVAMDIDSIRDLESFLKVEGQTASHRFLDEIGVNACLK